MLEKIEISIISQGLRHEETIVQITDALDNLNFAVTHIFDSINTRIKENGSRLDKIKDRAMKIQDKLDYIQKNLSMKAVKMYSSEKYPASHTYKEYEITVKPIERPQEAINGIYRSCVSIEDKFDTTLTCTQNENKQYTSVNLQEKLQFYHLKTKPGKLVEREKELLNYRPMVSSVSALLPFSSLKSKQESVLTVGSQKDDKYQIEDAPDSILQPWHPSELESPSNYMYAPALGEVPQINVPLILPDLPGIVDDERLNIDLHSQNPITPSSAAATPTLNVDLPSLDALAGTTSDSKTTKLPELVVKEPVVKGIVEQTPGPPPPPPPPPTIDVDYNLVSSTPAPPPLPPVKESGKKDIKTDKVTAKLNVSDDRTNLMAAIRDAGGFGRAKLKSTNESIDKNDRWASGSIEGDLMADLHAKLLQRRRNIVGISSETFKRMSSMIPPPPKPDDLNDHNSATSECDSQPDVDEWDE